MARRANKIKQEREAGGFVLVLDAGNSFVGDRDPAKKIKGQTSVTAMNMMSYDAMALGPTELALGLDVLRQRIAEAEFAVLSANAIVAASGELVATPYVLRQFDAHTVGIVGLSEGEGNQEIAVRDPVETAQTVVAELASRADVIILLSHAGASVDQQIAENVPGIDLVISGGGFGYDAPWRSDEGTLLLHADEASKGRAGLRLGIARLTFDAEGRLVEHKWQRLDLRLEVGDNLEMIRWVQEQTGW